MVRGRFLEQQGNAPAGAVQKLGADSKKVALLLLAVPLEVPVGAAAVALRGIAEAFEEDCVRASLVLSRRTAPPSCRATAIWLRKRANAVPTTTWANLLNSPI